MNHFLKIFALPSIRAVWVGDLRLEMVAARVEGKLAGGAVRKPPFAVDLRAWGGLIDIRKQVHAVDGGGGAQSRLTDDLLNYPPRLIGPQCFSAEAENLVAIFLGLGVASVDR